jgi:hypothetical protein
MSRRRQPKIRGQEFVEDYIYNYYYPVDRTTEMLSVSGSLSKGIEQIGGVLSIFPLYIRNKSSMLRNGITIPYFSDSWLVRGRINSRINRKCNLTYEVFYSYNKHQMEANRQYFSTNRLSESLKITFVPLKSIQIGYTFDHYCNQLTANKYKNFFFSDVSVSWLSGNRWELAFYVKNIFDERYYSYFIENELTSFYRSYTIRPRNILLSATYRF